jgi:hypothetical protein
MRPNYQSDGYDDATQTIEPHYASFLVNVATLCNVVALVGTSTSGTAGP